MAGSGSAWRAMSGTGGRTARRSGSPCSARRGADQRYFLERRVGVHHAAAVQHLARVQLGVVLPHRLQHRRGGLLRGGLAHRGHPGAARRGLAGGALAVVATGDVPAERPGAGGLLLDAQGGTGAVLAADAPGTALGHRLALHAQRLGQRDDLLLGDLAPRVEHRRRVRALGERAVGAVGRAVRVGLARRDPVRAALGVTVQGERRGVASPFAPGVVPPPPDSPPAPAARYAPPPPTSSTAAATETTSAGVRRRPGPPAPRSRS
ncbi:hypothetical protein STENM223S_01819 [Streptomyces tendae]